MTENEIDAALSRFGLPASPEDRDELLELLVKEILLFEHELDESFTGEEKEDHEYLNLLCQMLFSIGNLDDVLTIWRAKNINMDISLYLDVQLLCGAGYEKTEAFLASNHSTEAEQALKFLRQCNSDFVDFSPSKQVETYRKYWKLS